MRVLILYTATLFISLIGGELKGQEVLLHTSGDILHMSKEENGRLWVLTEEELFFAEAGSRVGEYEVPPGARQVFGLGRDSVAVIGPNWIASYEGGRELSRDTIPELVSCVLAMGEKLWLGTMGAGLYAWRRGRLDTANSMFAGKYINDLVEHAEQLAIALDDGVVVINPLRYDTVQYWPAGVVNHLAARDDSTLVASKPDGTVLLLLKKEMPAIDTLAVAPGVLDIATSLGEVFVLTEDACSTIGSRGAINELLKGRFQSILPMTHVLLLSGQSRVYKHDLTAEIVPIDKTAFSLHVCDAGNLWVGSQGEIIGIRADTIFRRIAVPSRIPSISVSAIRVYRDKIFAGTMGDGLYVFDSEGRLLSHLLDFSENNKNNIIALELEGDLLWVAYLNGVLSLDPQSYRLVKDFGSLLGNKYLYCFLPLGNEQFAVGTSGGGVLVYREGELKRYLDSKAVYSLLGQHDSLFVGVEDEGLYLIRNDSVQFISQIVDIRLLASLNQSLMAGGGNEVLLVGSNAKLRIPVSMQDYGELQLNAATYSGNSVYLGLESAIVELKKKRLSGLLERQIVLAPVKLFDLNIPLEKSSFSHDQHSFSFRFFHKEIYPGQETRYKYRMLGLDSQWHVTRENQLSFYQLSPGQYRFEVMDGALEGTEDGVASYAFEIHKPFWLQWWFWMVVIAILGLTGRYVIVKREEMLLREERRKKDRIRFELEQLKNQLDPHFLFNSLNSLIGLIEEDPDAAALATHKLSALYRNILLHEKSELLDIELELAIARDYFAIHQLRYEKNISLSIDVPQGMEGKLVPLSCQFLIENAVKHNVINAENHLHIDIAVEDDYCVVKNSLREKAANANPESGIGIQNLSRRYALITSRPVIVQRAQDFFIVKIPLIHV